jgi:Zn-dependent protease
VVKNQRNPERRPAARATHSPGWVIGRLAGAPIVLTPSWLLTAAILTAIFTPNISRSAPHLPGVAVSAVAFSFALILAISVFLHEVAHALVATRQGQTVTELAVTLWGGHTAFSNRARKPGQAALVAIVGPLTNLLLAGLFYLGLQIFPPGSIPALLCYAAFFSNTFVGLFNLLPGLPLDGGQILEAAVWRLSGWRTRGTIVAGWVGRVVAIGVALWYLVFPLLRGQTPNLTSALWMLMIAMFLWQGAGQAIVQAGRREQLIGLTARTLAMRTTALAPDATIADARAAAAQAATGAADFSAEGAGGPARTVLAVVNSHKEPVGWIEPEALMRVPEVAVARTPVSAVLVPFQEGSSVPISLSGLALLQHVDATSGGARVVPVVDSAGQLAGVLDIHEIAATVVAQRQGK